MTRQEQLDAVVRNYFKWPEKNDMQFAVWKIGPATFDGKVKFLQTPCREIDSFGDICHVFSRSEVEVRKAKLQNKPSWDDAPDWADWLAQDQKTGAWYWFLDKPEHGVIGFSEHAVKYGSKASDGEFIRGSDKAIEQRPEPEVTPGEEEAFNMLEARNGECIGGDWKPEPNDWAVSSGGAVMFYVGIGASGKHIFELENGGVTGLDSLSGFSPIKSDREMWKDAALHVEAELHDNYQPHELIEALYDAGLGKLPES